MARARAALAYRRIPGRTNDDVPVAVSPASTRAVMLAARAAVGVFG